MKTLAEIKNYFEKDLKTEIGKLEESRLSIIDRYSFKPYKRILKILLVLIALAITASIALPQSPLKWGTMLVPATALFAIVYPIVIGVTRAGKFNAILVEYKQTVLRKMLAFIDPGIRYQPSVGIDPRIFEDSLIFKGYSSLVYESEDLVTLKVDNISVKLADAKISQRSRNRDNSRQYYSVFSGIFLYAEMPYEFNSNVIVNTDLRNRGVAGIAKATMGGLVDKVFDAVDKINIDGDIVKLDDPEFEKYFVVFSYNSNDAKKILSAPIRQCMINYACQTQHDSQFSFTGKHVNIAIGAPDLFEWDVHASFMDFKKFEEYLTHLLLAVDAVRVISQINQKEPV